jgi:hypothetical protein
VLFGEFLSSRGLAAQFDANFSHSCRVVPDYFGMVGSDIEAFHRIVLETDQRLGTGSALGDTLHCAPSD